MNAARNAFRLKKQPPACGGNELLCFFGVNAYLLAGLVFSFELDSAVDLGEQRIVAAYAYVVARMIFGTSLAYQNGTCAYELTVCSLDTQSFRFTFAAVLGTADTPATTHIYTS